MNKEQELYEKARKLVASIASNEPRELKVSSMTKARSASIKNAIQFWEEAQVIRDAFFHLENANVQPTPCKFARKATHTVQRAFLDGNGDLPYEILEEDFQTFKGDQEVFANYRDGINNGNKNSWIKGTFFFVNDSASDLKLVLDDFDRREIVYWVLWDSTEAEYVVYTPYLNHGE